MESARSSFSIFSQDLIVTFLSLASSVFLARWLGPEQLGLFMIVSLIPTYSEKFGRIGNFDIAGVYYIKTKRYQLTDVVSHLTIISILSSLLPIILYALFSNAFQTYVIKTAALPKSHVWIGVLSVPFIMLLISYNKVFVGEHQIRTFNVIQIMRPALMIAGSLIFFFLHWNYVGVIIASTAAAIVAAGYSTLKMSQITPLLCRRINLKLVRDLLGYGSKIYFITIINFIHLRIDMLLVAIYLTPKQVSYYGMATTIGQLLWKVPNALSMVLFPKVASQHATDAADFTARASRTVVLVLSALSALMLIVSVPFIHLVYGADYLPLFKPLVLITPGIIAMGVARLLQEHFYGQGFPRGVVTASVVSAVINTVLNILLIPKYGISAAALASTITYTVFLGWLMVGFKKRWAKSAGDLLIPTTADMRMIFDRVKNYFRTSSNSIT
jgi:O-antigen/teichoic acid export membrane protein